MGWLHGVERKLENVVNNVFARAFRSEVEPIEIATRLTKELDSQAKLLNRDKRLVPNNFTVYLSTHDYDELAPMARAINDDIVPEMRRHAGRPGHLLGGEGITVRQEEGPGRGDDGFPPLFGGEWSGTSHEEPR